MGMWGNAAWIGRRGLSAGRMWSWTAVLTFTALSTWTAALSGQETGTVTGRVANAVTEAPIASAQVQVAGTQIGTLTRADGRFILPNLQVGTHEVTVRHIGFGSVGETVVVDAGETATVEFALRPEAIGLDEVVVTGLAGEARRREVGTVLTQVDMSRYENRVVGDMQTLLQGTAAGISGLQMTGQVGAGGTLQLRGITSVSQGNEPLVYIDGIRLSTNRIPPANLEDGRGPRVSQSPINELNPADIERIEVIKGAAATTLYGTEASGGVVQIFTKRGTTGSPQWTFSTSQGVNTWPRLNSVIRSDPTSLDLETIMRRGWSQRYDASVRGGTDRLGYYLSGSFSDDQGIVDTQESRYISSTGNLNVDLDGGFQLSWSNSYTRRNTRYVPDSNNRHGYLLNVMRLDKGYRPGSRDASWVLETELRGITDNFVSGLNAAHIGLGGRLRNNLQLGLNHIEAENTGLLPFGYYLYPAGNIGITRWRNRSLTLEYRGNWATPLSQTLQSTFAWGGQIYDESTVNVQASGLDFAGPGQVTVNSAAQTHSSESRIQQINAGFFFQETLGWRDRLFLIGGLRFDGSSTFGEDYGLQVYPKLSASYVISDESFWPGELVNTARIRAAVGEAGRAPGAFDAVRTWDPIAGMEGRPGVTPSNLGEPELGPERTREIELGMDLGLLDGRLDVELTAYWARTFDALFPVLPVPSAGFISSQLQNVGELQNSGIELSTGLTVIRRESVVWDVGVDLTTMHNEIADMGGAAPISVGYQQGIRQGHPAPSFFGRKLLNPDEMADPVLEEDVFLGETFPTSKVNIRSELTLGGVLTLSGLGELVNGGHVLNSTAFLNTVREIWPACDHVFAMSEQDRTTLTTARERFQCLEPWMGQDAWVEPGDFFKLRNVTASVRIPDRFLPPRAGSANLSFSANNLLTATDFTGLDPEVVDRGSSGTEDFRRVDYYNFPPRRSFVLKLNVSF